MNAPISPRLFIGNFDFEHRLADPKWAPSEKLKRINAEMASAWLSIAQDGDLIWTPLSYDAEFFAAASRVGLPAVIPISDLSQAPSGVDCIPWGWSAEIRQLVEKFGWKATIPGAHAVRQANSRRTSFELEQEWNVGLEGSRQIETLPEFRAAAQDQPDRRWVVKAEFSMSARERILGRGRPSETDENWVRRHLEQQGVVYFEPWADRISEVGIQIEVPCVGPPVVIGFTPMEVDKRGQYAGSWFAYDTARFSANQPFWDAAAEIALRAAARVQSLGYFGPLGIDAMVYRDATGSVRIRPLQDLNARWTMGRISLGWKRLVAPNEEGFWWHGAGESFMSPDSMRPHRLIRTSARTVGTFPCGHRTDIVLFTS